MDALACYADEDSESGGSEQGVVVEQASANKITEHAPLKAKEKKRLPPPGELLGPDDQTEKGEQPKERDHQGRVRSFAHVDGNWPTYVCFPVKMVDGLAASIARVCAIAREAFGQRKLVLIDPVDFHVSLSRTFALRYHQLRPFQDLLETSLKRQRSFQGYLQGFEFYSNDDKTRSFVGLNFVTGSDVTRALVSSVDKAVVAFGHRPYYKNPRLHVSVAWALGGELPELPASSVKLYDPIPLEPTQVVCQAGNRTHIVRLRPGK
mmetsp:Transcript_20619/g.48188  ORF Transcript_20619/g.48188 Transcript_20619/m.48188 type:complete len:264 (-) Transcript_20619:1314-2105(-)